MNEIESLFPEVIEYKKGIGIEDIVLDKSYLLDVHNNNVYNNIIIDYYQRLYNENISNIGPTKSSSISLSIIDNIKKCNKFFVINRYDFNMVKDFISTNLCHSKFCNNCKKVKQASRMSRYIKELEPYKDSLYHIIFTLPNCNGANLKSTLKKMSDSFRKIMRFINGTKKLSFIDFSKYGYMGAIRSLEITFKADSYHPHYHCCFAFNNLFINKNISNVYSYDFYGNKDIRYFSEFEVILQKLWFMCLNDINITKENFDKLDLGYSVVCNKFQDNDYAELFKYMTKETDETNNILTYDNFKILYFATLFLKQIQGYGIFYKINDSDLDKEVDIAYNEIRCYLEYDEKPILQFERPFDLLNDNNYKIISRKKIYHILQQLDKK